MVCDLQTFSPVTEMGRCEIYGADLYSAIPATKLKWVESLGLVMSSGSHGGPSGVVVNLKLWDIRSGNVVWGLEEKVDCFSDVTVSDSLSAIFRVGMNSGEVSYVDLRKLRNESSDSNQWICLGDERKLLDVKKEGVGCKIEAHGNQVFCSKGGDIELWAEVMMGSVRRSEDVKDMGGSRITSLAFGGIKMFATRKDQQSVEVWQSSVRGC